MQQRGAKYVHSCVLNAHLSKKSSIMINKKPWARKNNIWKYTALPSSGKLIITSKRGTLLQSAWIRWMVT